MNYKRYLETLRKIVDGETLIDEDYMTIAHLLGYLSDMHPVEAYIDGNDRIIKDNEPKLETFTAAELDEMDFESPSASELADRLEMCCSVVTKDGEWKYDRVPSDLVQDLLDFLHRLAKEDSHE